MHTTDGASGTLHGLATQQRCEEAKDKRIEKLTTQFPEVNGASMCTNESEENYVLPGTEVVFTDDAKHIDRSDGDDELRLAQLDFQSYAE